MPAATYNQTWEAGATYDETFQLLRSNGDPYDLSAFDPLTTVGAGGARMRIRRTVDETGASLINLKDSNHLTPSTDGYVQIIQPPTTGQIRIVIYAATMTALSYDTTVDQPYATSKRAGVYDLEVEGAGSTPVVLRMMKGSYSIDPEVTRPA